jgi:hypothetical protein
MIYSESLFASTRCRFCASFRSINPGSQVPCTCYNGSPLQTQPSAPHQELALPQIQHGKYCHLDPEDLQGLYSSVSDVDSPNHTPIASDPTHDLTAFPSENQWCCRQSVHPVQQIQLPSRQMRESASSGHACRV